MTDFPTVVTALALMLGGSEPAREQTRPRPAVVVQVPILMYHVVEDPPAGAPWPLLYVSAAEFSSQMAWLDRNGYTGTTLTEMWRNWHHGEALPPRPVVITFDDGYGSVFENALPVLEDLGWPGVLNLKVDNIGAPWGSRSGMYAGSSPRAGSSGRTRSPTPTCARSTTLRSSARWRDHAHGSPSASASPSTSFATRRADMTGG